MQTSTVMIHWYDDLLTQACLLLDTGNETVNKKKSCAKQTWSFGLLNVDDVTPGLVYPRIPTNPWGRWRTRDTGGEKKVCVLKNTEVQQNCLTLETVPFSSTNSGALLLTGSCSVSSWHRQQKRLWKMLRLRGFLDEDAACVWAPENTQVHTVTPRWTYSYCILLADHATIATWQTTIFRWLWQIQEHH